MVDNREPPKNAPDPDRQATLREWARKHYLRDHMREDALLADEFKLLDERLSRWTADRTGWTCCVAWLLEHQTGWPPAATC